MFTVLTVDKKWYGDLLFYKKPKVFLCGDKNGCYYKAVSNREYTYKDLREIKKLCGIAFNRLVVAKGVLLPEEYSKYIVMPKLLKCHLAVDLAIRFLYNSISKRVVFCDRDGSYIDLAYKLALESSSMQVITSNAYSYYKLKGRLLYEEGIVLTILDREVETGDCAVDLNGDTNLNTEVVFAPFGEGSILPVSVCGDEFSHLYIDGICDFLMLQALFEWGNAGKLATSKAQYFEKDGEEYSIDNIKLLT